MKQKIKITLKQTGYQKGIQSVAVGTLSTIYHNREDMAVQEVDLNNLDLSQIKKITLKIEKNQNEFNLINIEKGVKNGEQ